MRSTVEIQSDIEGRTACGPAAPWSQPITSRHVEALFSDAGPASVARRARLQSNAAFPAAVRQSASMLLELYEGKRILNLIISDRGRFFVSLFALDLHFRRSANGIGLTPGRLKDMCREQSVCSATRTNAVLTLMKLGGYIEAAPDRRDRRLRELVPTEKLFTNLRRRWRCHLAPAASLLPDAEHALTMLNRHEFVHGLVRLISAHYCAGFRFTDHVPALRLFADRDGGLFVLFSLLAAAEADSLGRQASISISVSRLARTIGSSRAHIVKLLKDAESEGLIKRPDPGSIVLMPPLVRDLYEFFALNYLFLTHFAMLTCGYIGAPISMDAEDGPAGRASRPARPSHYSA